MVSLLLSKPRNHILLELEGQPQYFTERKIDLIIFYRISTKLADLDSYRQEIQTDEVGKVQNVNK